ncbi:hypothetical protein AYI68_g2341 [Smittium mucronatum]|uniref:Uncharacterized protein n=1 Tax=Smittium mucronatum TaxID=133383 RepID=A0A1R0H319_9FUNG|nr:hypothetical protein AYI68_g2341 [Smittium mucronatum]
MFQDAQEILLRFSQMEYQLQATDIVIDDNHIDKYVVDRAPAKNLGLYPKLSSVAIHFKRLLQFTYNRLGAP